MKSQNQTAILAAQNISFSYTAAKDILKAVNFNVRPGKFVCILGPNGSGKTTFLRCLLGWLKPSSGNIHLADKPLRQYSHRDRARIMGYVPQFPDSAFAFTVKELVLMGRYARTGSLGLLGQDDIDSAAKAMDLTETAQFADRRLNQLSGGEAQRVMIARALAQEPKIILLDEPTSHLDLRNQMLIYRLMQRLANEQSMAVVCVSHDINLAGRFADELLLMKDGQVLANGPSKQVINQETLQNLYDLKLQLINAPNQNIPIVLAQ